MRKELKACIFDLDGVLVDTAKYHYLSWQKLAQSLGFEFTEEDNEQLKGISRMASLEIVLSKGDIQASESEKKNMCVVKNELYIDFIGHLKQSDLLPGVYSLLKELQQNRIKIALGSASKNARMVLDKLEISSLFDAIVDGTNVSKSKPDPEVFIRGAELLGVSPAACVVFEDAEKGIEAAKNGGFACIGVGPDYRLGIADMQVHSLEGFDYRTLVNFWNTHTPSNNI